MNLKHSLFVCLIIALSFVTARAQSGLESWKRYTVTGRNFSVALPTLPALSYYPPSPHSRGWVMLGAYADGVVYAIEVYENKRPHDSLADFVTGQLPQDTAPEKQISVDGVAGSEFSSGTLKFFATQLWLYRFMVVGTTADDPRAQRFFSSLSFAENAQGIAVSEGPGTPYQADTDETPLTGKEVERKARLGQKPEPRYTEEARQNQVTGTVVLKCIFRANGNVTDIRILNALPNGLTENAVAAAKKIKFIPAIKDGHYVAMWMQLEYNFNLY